MKKQDKRPEPDLPPNPHYVKVLYGIVLFWIGMFLLTLTTKNAEIRALMPLATLVFIGYTIYVTYRLWKDGQPPTNTKQ